MMRDYPGYTGMPTRAGATTDARHAATPWHNANIQAGPGADGLKPTSTDKVYQILARWPDSGLFDDQLR